MDTLSYIRDSLKWGHEIIAMVVADLTPEMAHDCPPGLANPIGATYAHAVAGEDGVVNGLLRGQSPLYATTWAGRTGISDPQFQQSTEWARSVQVDAAQLAEYFQAVAADTDAWLGSLTEADLDRELDLTSQGLGKRTLGWCLHALVIGHLHNMAGEISALKGTQGAQGYPF
jgi:hypothetical protein